MISRIAPLLLTAAVFASSAGAQTAEPAAPATPAPTTPAAATPAAATATSGGAAYTPFTAPTPPVDLVATLSAAGKFSTLLKAMDAAGLTGPLKGPTNLTLFAPTDDAFAALPPGTLDNLLKPENRAQLQKLLMYHLINAPVPSSAVIGHAAGDVASGAGPKLHIDGSGGVMKVNDADVVETDVKASNGMVQVIDKVLTPPTSS